MKQKKASLFAVILVCLLTSAVFLLSSFKSHRAADDMWKAIGLSQQAGTEGIKNSFINGYLYYYGARNIKNIAVGDRVTVAKDLLEYTKQYISGADFKKKYEDIRKSAKPSEPQLKPLRTRKEIQRDEITKTEKSIKDTEKTIKEVTPDMAKGIQPLLDMLKKNLKDYQDPNNEFFANIEMSEKYQQEDQIKRYKEGTLRWEKDYPENINMFIAEKLKKMLEATKGIDYNAALAEKYGKKRFVNPSYEGKGTEWKQGYRAGKDVTETARAFAQKWLSELK